MTSFGNLSNLKLSGLITFVFSQLFNFLLNLSILLLSFFTPSKSSSKVELDSPDPSSKVEFEMSEHGHQHPHQQATASSPERRRPRKLDRTRSDQDSVRSGQKHTVLNDTETESTFPGPADIVQGPSIEGLVIEEDTTQQRSSLSSPQLRQTSQARRKPRKLLRTTTSPPGPSTSTDPGLDARVNRLEQQVQSMSRRLDNTVQEISRLQSSTQAPQFQRSRSGASTPQRLAAPTQLQTEILRNAQLATVTLEQRAQPSVPVGTVASSAVVLAERDDDVENVPRYEDGGVERRPGQQRTVSLTGNYKIPLPSTLSTDDVRAIKEGVFAAGSIAKEITAALRGAHSADGFPVDDDGGGGGVETPKSPGGWVRLIEGASQLVAKAAHAIELDAAVEATTGEVSDGRELSSRPAVLASAVAGQQGTGGHTKWRKKTGVKATSGGSSMAETSNTQTGEAARNSDSKGKRPAPIVKSASGVAA